MRRLDGETFSRLCFLAEKKKSVQKYANKNNKINWVVENRAQHASQRHLICVLKTDSNLASKCLAGNDAALACACVCLPGRAPGGNTRQSRVRCVSSFFSSGIVRQSRNS